MQVPLVIIESPYAGEVERNIRYAKRAILDSFAQGESPLAFHLLHTQVLNDEVPSERDKGITMGLQWTRVATRVVVYGDYGISYGMRLGIDMAHRMGIPVIFRRIGCNPEEPLHPPLNPEEPLHALDISRRLPAHEQSQHPATTEHVVPRGE